MAELANQTLEIPPLNIALVGATGKVGDTMLKILASSDLPVDSLRLLASERSTGKIVTWKDREIVVENAAETEYQGLDIVLMSAGATASKELAPQISASGAVVIDNSSAWRRNHNVPLVVAEVNPGDLDERPLGIVSNPNCTTMLGMVVLKPLHDAAGLRGLVYTSLQSSSGAGKRGDDELAAQLSGSTAQEVFPEQIAHNVIPLRGNLVGRDTDEEEKLKYESRKILHASELLVSATCGSVPVFTGHSLSIEASFEKAITPEEAEEILSSAAGVRLDSVPTPLKAAGGDVSLVGRIRQSGIYGESGLSLFVTGDNIRKGAALNTVQLAELIGAKLLR